MPSIDRVKDFICHILSFLLTKFSRAPHKIDRLGGLPDDVICHILSFLPTKFSVATSVLASRWRFLWTRVPCFNFDETFYWRKTPYSNTIIRHFLLQHEAKSITTFTFNMNYGDNYQFDKLLATAIKRNVRNLDLNFYGRVMWPRTPLFTCKTVVDMTLRLCKCIPSSADVCFPSLRKLYLNYVGFEGDDTLPNLLYGSPKLEELIFNRWETEDLSLNISSSSLKVLRVTLEPYWLLTFSGYKRAKYQMIINAPALRHLHLHGSRIGIPVNMNPLFEVEIFFKECSTNSNCSYEVKFLSCICDTKGLNLSGYNSNHEVVDREVAESSLKFNNITKLELQVYDVKWHLLLFKLALLIGVMKERKFDGGIGDKELIGVMKERIKLGRFGKARDQLHKEME
ncbi:F-box/RNI-like/FBD-like domains-containing protein [Striga asiatica]|uniref:F-box/RNI-like/FBD-like domains-containing protein n=1 Tax=Striga asiatica TaxID=4170 RepID=A0A5A7QJ99_STRAF|nr:F-box/RNI-like/FBD-like domains-containing protein [Striga asiatica]